MRPTTVSAGLLALALFGSGYAQTFDKDKLDRFLDRLAEKNKGMGRLTVAKDGNVLYSHSFGYSFVTGAERKPATETTETEIETGAVSEGSARYVRL